MFPQALIGLIITLVVIGLLIYLVMQIPMDPAIANLIRVVGIIIAVLVVLWWLMGMMPMGYWYPHPR